MRTISAYELKVGMEIDVDGLVVSVEHKTDFMCVCFQTYDYECGEVEYHPVEVSYEEEFNIL